MRCPELQSYLPLIAQKAIRTWYKLPPHYRVWVDVEDLIQEGVLFARFHVFPRYKPSRSKFTTYLTAALDNYFLSIGRGVKHKKRCQSNPCNTI